MRKTKLLLAASIAAIALVLVVPVSASAGDITLHPSGFGDHSYAAWKADQGLPDNAGNKDQALYFQKHTATETFAAGVAVFKGVAGLDTAELVPLGFKYRTDGWCGAGAPRFNLRVENPPGSGIRQTFFFGCNSGMFPTGGGTHEGRVFDGRTTVGTLPPGDVVSLAIVFDEGTTQFGLPLGPGHTWLDDIRVGDRIWRSASDNGNGGTTTANTAVTTAELVEILGEPLNVAFVS
jgi:hypothetical protein